MSTPNKDDSLIAAIEGNDAGMSKEDLVLTVQMLRNGRKRWMDEANQLRAERDELKKRDALELIALQNKKLRTELERVKAELAPRNGHTFESLQKMWEDTHVELAATISKLNTANAVIKDDCENEEAFKLHARKVLTEFQVEGDSNGVPTFADMGELMVAEIQKLRSELERVKGDRDNAVKAYEDVKAWGHRLESNLETLLAECDENACGSEDSAPVEKFANRLIGLCNEIQLGNVRTLRSQLATLMAIAIAANSDAPIPNRLDDIEKAITAAQEQGIEIK